METSESIHPERGQSLSEVPGLVNVGRVLSVSDRHKSVFFMTCENGTVKISFVTEQIIRITIEQEASDSPSHTIGLVKSPDGASVPVQVSAEEDVIVLATDELRVIIWKDPLRISIVDAEGQVVFQQETCYVGRDGSFHCELRTSDTSHFYGLGEKTGHLDKRDERYEMWNSDVYAPHVPDIEALYVSVPFLIHVQGDARASGLFLDNPGRTYFDMQSQAELFSIGTHTGAFDLYVIDGCSIKGVVTAYTELTGRMQLPPKWALGYHQSRYSYMNQDEVLTVAKSFREKRIPCDVIHLDIHYMHGYRVFTFDRQRFPDPKRMIAALGEQGFHVVPIVDPGVKRDPRYGVYRDGVDQDHFCKDCEGQVFAGDVWPGEAVFPDFSDPKTRAWWGEQHRFYTEQGISGIWNDMNEPAIFNDIKTMPNHIMHRNDGHLATHEELHNLYGLWMAKATYEGLRTVLDGLRPFVLTRSGYAGIQRYAAVWTGDNRSYWEHMEMAIPMVLNMGLSGIAFAGPDVGGFSHHTTGELLARWTQMGAFFPFFRNHSAIDTRRQEPWVFGEAVEAICRAYIELRYRLLPHLYSLFHEASQTGLPVIRPVFLEYPSDPEVGNLSDQFLFGSQVMVAPVLRPGQTHRMVYLPEGIWYDYWTGKPQRGSNYFVTAAPLATLPLFIKAGTMFAEQDQVQSLAETTVSDLTLNVYCGNDQPSVYTFYDDDGMTFAYQDGDYQTIKFQLQEGPGTVELYYDVVHSAPSFDGRRWRVIVRSLAFMPTQVVTGTADTEGERAVLPFSYDERHDQLEIELGCLKGSGLLNIL